MHWEDADIKAATGGSPASLPWVKTSRTAASLAMRPY
jgi:hypothetical protein